MTSQPRSHGDLSFWRCRAEEVEAELADITATFRAADPDGPDHIHYLFAELYLAVTRRWLALLAERQDSAFAYRVICHFLRLYRLECVDRLTQPLDTVSPHWRAYHRLARHQTIRSPITAHLILISVGARAHTHGDLGRAMCLAEEEMGSAVGKAAPALDAERQRIFGEISDKAFYGAARDYTALQHSRHRGWRRIILRIYGIGLVLLKPVWMPTFQRWRRVGHAQALAARDTTDRSARVTFPKD
ncbi:hypothetical protein HKCCE4037_14940 [Rhodobacterales bacterium HKCCE4037]|nr:hypothetical protein [Rhodobacterales bacterium HKCCE4037]